jgi:galactokinase
MVLAAKGVQVVDVERLRAEFLSIYGGQAQVFSAPGRVNLIGEHTDYNDGFVLPMAIERRTYVACALNGSSRVRARSATLEQAGELDLQQPTRRATASWLDYIEGMAHALIDRGLPVTGADLLVDSDVPPGAGLSASAALELSVGIALATLGGTSEPDRVKLALAGQAAEHLYVGTLCGIMDQYIAALGQSEAALLIDCRTLETRSVPLRLADSSVLICDTRVRHELSSSEYNQRRKECERGLGILKAFLPDIQALRDVSAAQLEQHARELPASLYRRCRHVVRENERTLAAADALSRGDLPAFGALMSESHASLRDDYQVSCVELDVAVEAAMTVRGVCGSRMTGGGFGGCTVSIVENDVLDRVVRAVKTAFAVRGWREPELFASKACEGVRRE